MTKEVEAVPEGLLKIKQVSDVIQKRYFSNPESRVFEFELGGFGIELKNENDYLELLDILGRLKPKAGIEYKITKFYIDHRGRKQFFTLYDSQKCKIKITDITKFKNYHKEISQRYRSIEDINNKKSTVQKSRPVLIKNARLDEQNYLLEINGGEKIISFRSKKGGSGLEKETKQFRILFHLWDFKWELKDGRVLEKGDYVSLDNLTRSGMSESADAAYKHIQRLNKRFQNEGLAIEIQGENEKYRLIINKA